jgi:NAD(P)H dehydrogenase (quinone)
MRSPMKVALVYCHPCEASFNAAVRDEALGALRSAGHEVQLIDLYAMGFDPVLTAAQRRDYHTPGVNEAGVEEHLAALRWCEALIFIYPTWWYGLPAMLKGWLDRVWLPHATFSMPEGNKPIGRVLTNIRLIGAISTLGSPKWWWWLMGAPGRRTLLTGLSVLCAPRCRTFWLGLHRMDNVDLAGRKAFLGKVRAKLVRL